MWETRVRWGGEEHRIHVAPDKVFGLELPDGSKRYYFLEMDRGTMPVLRTDLRRTSLLRKFLSYSATYYDQLHRRLFNLSGFSVLTVTTSKARVGTCIAEQQNLASAHRRSLFLFIDQASLVEVRDALSSFWRSGGGKSVRLLRE